MPHSQYVAEAQISHALLTVSCQLLQVRAVIMERYEPSSWEDKTKSSCQSRTPLHEGKKRKETVLLLNKH